MARLIIVLALLVALLLGFYIKADTLSHWLTEMDTTSLKKVNK